jgi:small subunit ribosomal protein S1
MNSHDDTEATMDEGYWQAILSQGEIPVEQTTSASSELWDGLPYHLVDTNAEEDAQQLYQNDGAGDRWAKAQECFEEGKVIELVATGYNRGGLLVDWDGLRGFVPASHLLDFSPYLDEERRLAELAQRVGTSLKVKVIELDPREDRFILSQRMTTDETQRRTELLAQISPGDVCQGHVTNLCTFGAFVDLGGIEGLIHISELSWGRVDHPQDVLDRGQLVDVHVLNVDPAEGRVGLSLKRLLPDPWMSVEERYQPGQLVEGVITNVVNFGAFTRIEEGLEGLIHVSELAEGSFLHPRNVVEEGDAVVCRVLSLDSRRRRMALSLRQTRLEEAADTNDDMEVDVWTTSSSPAAATYPVPDGQNTGIRS